MPSILEAFGIEPGAGSPALLPPLGSGIMDRSLLSGARVVVLIVVDGYGWRLHHPRRTAYARDPGRDFIERRITSVVPSTTAAALTSLQTGVAPAGHGMAGYTLFIPRAGRVVNLVRFVPVDGGPFDQHALDLSSFLPVPTVYEMLAHDGVESVVVSHREYATSPLTAVHSGAVPYFGHRTLAEFAGMLVAQVERPGRRFIFGYWASIDMLAHSYGPSSEIVAAETDLLVATLTDYVLAPLAAHQADVAVVITADHGLADTPGGSARSLHELGAVTGGWTSPPTGERRAVGLGLSGPEARKRLRQSVGRDGVVLAAGEAIEAGLYGPPPRHPELHERIGDTLLLARNRASFPFRPARDGVDLSLGGHGSLTPDEMLVPLLVYRLGS